MSWNSMLTNLITRYLATVGAVQCFTAHISGHRSKDHSLGYSLIVAYISCFALRVLKHMSHMTNTFDAHPAVILDQKYD